MKMVTLTYDQKYYLEFILKNITYNKKRDTMTMGYSNEYIQRVTDRLTNILDHGIYNETLSEFLNDLNSLYFSIRKTDCTEYDFEFGKMLEDTLTKEIQSEIDADIIKELKRLKLGE